MKCTMCFITFEILIFVEILRYVAMNELTVEFSYFRKVELKINKGSCEHFDHRTPYSLTIVTTFATLNRQFPFIIQ